VTSAITQSRARQALSLIYTPTPTVDLGKPGLILGDNLDTEHIAASYDTGVLTLQIPVAEQAKPRKITITSKGEDRQAINA
jgi:hypothetical protein